MVPYSVDERRRLDSTNVYTLHEPYPILPSLLVTASTSTVSNLTIAFADHFYVSTACVPLETQVKQKSKQFFTA